MSQDKSRRAAIMLAAQEKWEDKSIALIEKADGALLLQALGGDYDWKHDGAAHEARSRMKVYWSGRSLEEAEAAVGLRGR